MNMDETHLQMLEELRADGRMSMSALADRVGISRANAYARLEAMQEAGIIRGFTVDVEPARAGRPIGALVFVSLHQDRWAQFRENLRSLDQLDYFAVTTGQFDGMMLLRAGSVGEVHQLVVSVIAHWPAVRSTETVFLMDEEYHPWNLHPTPPDAGSPDSPGITRFVSAPERSPNQ